MLLTSIPFCITPCRLLSNKRKSSYKESCQDCRSISRLRTCSEASTFLSCFLRRCYPAERATALPSAVCVMHTAAHWQQEWLCCTSLVGTRWVKNSFCGYVRRCMSNCWSKPGNGNLLFRKQYTHIWHLRLFDIRLPKAFQKVFE